MLSESGNKMFSTCHADARIRDKIRVEFGNMAHYFNIFKIFMDVSKGG